MSVSVELFVGVQGFSGFCLLAALSRLTARARPPYGRLAFCALGTAGITWLLLCFAPPASAGPSAVMMNLLVPFAALGRLPCIRRVRASGTYLLLNLLLEGCLRTLYSLGLPALPAMLLASVGALLLPGMGQRMRPLPATRVEVRWRGRSVCLSALVDSGNLLRDGVTGLPVVVCSQQALSPLLPRMCPGMLPEGFRYLSVRTAAGGALMPCFHPESVRLLGNGGWTAVEAVVGLTVDGYSDFQALVPACLTRETAFSAPASMPAGMSRREGL